MHYVPTGYQLANTEVPYFTRVTSCVPSNEESRSGG